MQKLSKKLDDWWKRSKKWEKSSLVGDLVISTSRAFFFLTIALIIFWSLFIVGPFSEDVPAPESPTSNASGATDDKCSVYAFNLHGSIVTYIPLHAEGDTFFDYDSVASEDVIVGIQGANADPKIKAIIIEVDSLGGSPVAAEEIANEIKNSKKPVVAFIRGSGTSAGYWSISSANRIFASQNSDVGSIGVTMSYLSGAEKNKKDGLTYEMISSGKFKDSGDPDKVLTSEEKSLFLRDVNIIYDNFVKAVSENRNLTVTEVKSFADGSTFLGAKAQELGLVDEIGGINEVEKYLEKTLGEKPEICWQ